MSSFCTCAFITVRVVVDVLEQHGLVAERNAGVGQPAERVAHFRRQFARMVRVDAHEERMKFFQHRAQFRRDALRQKNRDARADPQKFHMRNRAQAAQQMFQFFVAQQQRVAAAQEHVADFRVRGDVGDLLVEFGMKIVAGRVADQPRARAITAIRRAAVRHEKQHAVGIAMHEPGTGECESSPHGSLISHDAVCVSSSLGMTWRPDRAVFIRRINQVEKIRRDGRARACVFASFAPANSSGVSVGRNFCNCSAVVMRCLSCQCQSFQSASETSRQKPRPAERNFFKA